MPISPQWKEVEKMLIHHFEAETQGFQGLVDQNDRGKPKFWKKHFFGGFRRWEPLRMKPGISQWMSLMKIFFWSSRWWTRVNQFFVKYIEIYWNTTLFSKKKNDLHHPLPRFLYISFTSKDQLAWVYVVPLLLYLILYKSYCLHYKSYQLHHISH